MSEAQKIKSEILGNFKSYTKIEKKLHEVALDIQKNINRGKLSPTHIEGYKHAITLLSSNKEVKQINDKLAEYFKCYMLLAKHSNKYPIIFFNNATCSIKTLTSGNRCNSTNNSANNFSLDLIYNAALSEEIRQNRE